MLMLLIYDWYIANLRKATIKQTKNVQTGLMPPPPPNNNNPWVMSTINCSIILIQLDSTDLWPWPWVFVHCDLDLGDKTLGRGYETPLGHGQQLFEIISWPNMELRSYGPTRILGMRALRPWPWRYYLESRSWHSLGLWTTIVWNINQMGQGGKKLWLGQFVNRRTDRRADRVIPIYPQTLIPKLCLV